MSASPRERPPTTATTATTTTMATATRAAPTASDDSSRRPPRQERRRYNSASRYSSTTTSPLHRTRPRSAVARELARLTQRVIATGRARPPGSPARSHALSSLVSSAPSCPPPTPATGRCPLCLPYRPPGCARDGRCVPGSRTGLFTVGSRAVLALARRVREPSAPLGRAVVAAPYPHFGACVSSPRLASVDGVRLARSSRSPLSHRSAPSYPHALRVSARATIDYRGVGCTLRSGLR